MKCTLVYLKYVVVGLLGIILLLTGGLAAIGFFIGILGFAVESDPGYLAFVPIGLVSGLLCAVILDGLCWIIDNWRV